MKESLKHFVEAMTPLGIFARYRRIKRFREKLNAWKEAGSVLPMPHLGKQLVIQEYLEKLSPAIFVETGTYKGDMVYAMLPNFKEIYSIELDETLFQKAQKKFAWYSNVHIMHGQSGEILPKILKGIGKPCLFWLDAHWSGGPTAKGEIETPIMQELQCILNHRRAEDDVVLIDDARCFTGKNDFPSLKTLEGFILDTNPSWIFEVKDDIIRIYSKKHGVSHKSQISRNVE